MGNKFAYGDIFHVFNKSIAGFEIFSKPVNCERYLKTLDYYNDQYKKFSLSRAVREKGEMMDSDLLKPKENSYVKFVTYCIMPTHYHLLVKILKSNCLPKYISDVENSYVRFFNLKYNRKGPLWQSSFKSVKIRNNEQLLHVSRYIHLNPVTGYLTDDPEKWQYSSFGQCMKSQVLRRINEISIGNPETYGNFVRDNADYQRKLNKIKKLIFE